MTPSDPASLAPPLPPFPPPQSIPLLGEAASQQTFDSVFDYTMRELISEYMWRSVAPRAAAPIAFFALALLLWVAFAVWRIVFGLMANCFCSKAIAAKRSARDPLRLLYGSIPLFLKIAAGIAGLAFVGFAIYGLCTADKVVVNPFWDNLSLLQGTMTAIVAQINLVVASAAGFNTAGTAATDFTLTTMQPVPLNQSLTVSARSARHCLPRCCRLAAVALSPRVAGALNHEPCANAGR